MKFLLIFILLTACVGAKELGDENLGFRITFPESQGWTPVQRRELTNTMSGWFSHYAGGTPAERLTTVLTVALDRRPKNETYAEYARLWHEREFGERATSSHPIFLNVGGRDACEFMDTQTDHSGRPEYLKTVLVRVGDLTYAATFIASDPTKLGAAVGSQFLHSLCAIELGKAPSWPQPQ